jgi:hypothetical protein
MAYQPRTPAERWRYFHVVVVGAALGWGLSVVALLVMWWYTGPELAPPSQIVGLIFFIGAWAVVLVPLSYPWGVRRGPATPDGESHQPDR